MDCSMCLIGEIGHPKGQQLKEKAVLISMKTCKISTHVALCKLDLVLSPGQRH